MGRGRFVNQKLGKRTSRKVQQLKSRLPKRRSAAAKPNFRKRSPKKTGSQQL